MREKGYYWVKVCNRRDWRVAMWDGKFWNVPTLSYLVPDSRLQQIDERRIVREVE
ncbi:MAG: hypothetical protein ACRDC4_03040 [Plesiomonas sp.]